MEHIRKHDLEPIADRITQDMLIIGANQDHFIDYRLVGREINMLINVSGFPEVYCFFHTAPLPLHYETERHSVL